MSKKNPSKTKELQQKAEKVQRKFEIFLAEVVKEYNLMIIPTVKYTDFGILPSFNIYEATQEQIEKAEKKLELNQTIIKNLGK